MGIFSKIGVKIKIFCFFDAPSFGPLSKAQSGRLFYLKPPFEKY